VLPEDVLKEAQENLFALPGVGMSILEISHRSKTFDKVINEAKADLKSLLSINEKLTISCFYRRCKPPVLYGTVKFNAPKNKADYIITGSWSKKALKEAKRVGATNIAATTESENFTRIPKQEELKLDADASYVHFTSTTQYGTEWHKEPEVGNVPACLRCIFRHTKQKKLM